MKTRTEVTKSSSASATKMRATSPVAAKWPKDACALLDADHKAVKALFNEYKTLAESQGRSLAKRRQLADQICKELTVHATIEEEIFYPAVLAAIKDKPLMNEAKVEHASAKDLIAQIRGMEPSDEMFDAKVTVLGEYIDHHVKEERSEMFVKARNTSLDLEKLGEQLQLRKQALMAEQERGSSSVTEMSRAH